jgi:hypothetical protein
MEIENVLSPQESLRIIAGTLAKTRENIAKNSFSFLLWGWLITIASFSCFVLQYYAVGWWYFVPFPVFAAVGIATTLLHYIKRRSRETETHIDHFLGKMWLVLGSGFIMVVFINVSQGRPPFTYTLLIAGLGTLISGLVLQFRPLIAGGVFLLISTIASVYIQDSYQVLLHGVAVAGGYLVPGYLLKNEKS